MSSIQHEKLQKVVLFAPYPHVSGQNGWRRFLVLFSPAQSRICLHRLKPPCRVSVRLASVGTWCSWCPCRRECWKRCGWRGLCRSSTRERVPSCGHDLPSPCRDHLRRVFLWKKSYEFKSLFSTFFPSNTILGVKISDIPLVDCSLLNYSLW